MSGVIDLLAKLNWFERADELFRWFAGVRSHRFAVSRNCGWSGQQIESMLKKYGVRVWGRGFTRDTLTFRVIEKNANWAEYLLHQHSIPVYSRPVDERNIGYPERPYFTQNQKPQKQSGLLESLLSALFD